MPIFEDDSIIGFDEVLITDTVMAVSHFDTFSTSIVYQPTHAETSFVSHLTSEITHSDYAVYVKFFLPEIPAGEEHTMNIALIGGSSIEALLECADDAQESLSDTVEIVCFQDIAESALKPEIASLHVYPNPFNSVLNINNPFGGDIEIYDIKGNLITRLATSNGFGNNANTTSWNIHDSSNDRTISSGVYLVRAVNNPNSVKRIVYIK